MKTRRSVLRLSAAPALTVGLALCFAYLAPANKLSSASAQVTSPVGSYGVLVNQWANSNDDVTSAFLGVLTFDGSGNITGTYTVVNQAYTLFNNGSLTGTYSGNPDGSNTVNFALDVGATVTAAMAVTDGGTGIQFLVTGGNIYQQGAVINGTGRIQSAQGTVPAGSYGYLLNRWQDGNNNPETLFGILNLDGAGNVTASYTVVFGGGTPTTSGTLNGTYSINPDGTGTMALNDNGQFVGQVQFAIVVTDGGAGILMLQTAQSNNNGVLNHVIAGTARLQ
jgi:hypothetical protein